MMKREAREKHRLITSDAHYAVFCPYAARVPFETWIVPRRHQSLFANGAEGSENHLARVLRETLRRLDRALKHELQRVRSLTLNLRADVSLG